MYCGAYLTVPSIHRNNNQSFDLDFKNGEFYIDIENNNDEEVQIHYQVSGCWVPDSTQYGHDPEYAIREGERVIRERAFSTPQLQVNKIETAEEKEARQERERIERERRQAEMEKVKEECAGLIAQIPTLNSEEELDALTLDIDEIISENRIGGYYKAHLPEIDNRKRELREQAKQAAQQKAWDELTEEIGEENAEGIKDGGYYVFQGQNNEWFAIGGPQKYLYNLDRDEKYCLTINASQRLPEPDQIYTKIMWAKNNVEYVFETANVVGKLTDELRDIKRELVQANKFSVKSILRLIGRNK